MPEEANQGGPAGPQKTDPPSAPEGGSSSPPTSSESAPEGAQQQAAPADTAKTPAEPGGGATPPAPADKPAAAAEKPAVPAEKPAAPAAAAKPAAAAGAKPAGPPAAGAKPAAAAAPKAPPTMQTVPWEGELPEKLKAAFGERISEFLSYVGQDFLVAKPEAVIPIIEHLKTDEGFDYLVDLTATDAPDKPERFELIYILYSFSRNHRIRIKTRIKEGDKLPTAVNLHLTADWLEREVYDMFGIEFEGHPNMTRILMPEGWTGWPLRKDVSILDMDQRWVKENLGIESGQ